MKHGHRPSGSVLKQLEVNFFVEGFEKLMPIVLFLSVLVSLIKSVVAGS